MPVKIIIRGSLIATIFLLLLTSPGWGTWSHDSDVNNLICGAPDTQGQTHIASDGAGGAIIAWQDKRSGTWAIYAQRVDASGNTLWAEDGILLSPQLGEFYIPVIAADGQGGAFLVWHEGPADDRDLHAQRVDASGNLLWGPTGSPVMTHPDATVSHAQPRLLPDAAGGVYVTWKDDRYIPDDIFAQRLDADGTSLWTENGVAIFVHPSASYSNPVFCSDGEGGVYITCNGYGADADVYCQRALPDGSLPWGPDGRLVCGFAEGQSKPSIVSDSEGGAILAWSDSRNSWFDPEIWANRINSEGNLLWPVEGRRISWRSGSMSRPKLVAAEDSGTIIHWDEFISSEATTRIFAQRIDGAGDLQWQPEEVSICAWTSSQFEPCAFPDGEGGAIIAFGSRELDEDGDGIAQRLDRHGNRLWSSTGVPFTTAPTRAVQIAATSDDQRGAIFTWYDSRTGEHDVYAQKVNASGELGVPASVVDLPTGSARLSFWPNPFWEEARLRFYAPVSGRAELAVYSIDGRRVAELGNFQISGAGAREISWNGRDETGAELAAGIYLVRLRADRFMVTQRVVRLSVGPENSIVASSR